uniref:Uncharacterized protein n=1 Tax=Medicago truncatula TaxID=3880 RepID=I3T6N4_MEDTR|nr:unknown [Medicago truncatula]
MSSSSNPTNPFPFPSSQSNFNIPSKNYAHTMTIGTPEISQNSFEEKEATIELHVQGLYKLYIQPFQGLPPLSMERGFIVSPKFIYKLKFPLFYLRKNPNFFSFCVSQKLAKLPISPSLVAYIEPHIVQNAIEVGNRSQDMEFKIVFDVKVVEIDFADIVECDGYRRRGLV